MTISLKEFQKKFLLTDRALITLLHSGLLPLILDGDRPMVALERFNPECLSTLLFPEVDVHQGETESAWRESIAEVLDEAFGQLFIDVCGGSPDVGAEDDQ